MKPKPTDTLTLRINVTQEDIDEGRALDCFRCPVARALLRAAQAADLRWVSADYVDLEVRKGQRFDRWIGRTPAAATAIMRAVDGKRRHRAVPARFSVKFRRVL